MNPPGPPPTEARRVVILVSCTVAVCVMLGVFTIVSWLGKTSSDDASDASARASDLASAVLLANTEAQCRTEFATWVQESRDHVVNGQGTATQAVYRGLKAQVEGDGDALAAAILLGDGGDKEIGDWNELVPQRRRIYQRLQEMQREEPGMARVACKRGPPK